MKEKIIKVYNFEDLSEEVKDEVLSHFRYINVDFEWYDGLLEEYIEEIKKSTGWEFEEKDVVFSLGVRDGMLGVKSESIIRNIEEIEGCDVEASNLPRYIGAFVGENSGYCEIYTTEYSQAKIECEQKRDNRKINRKIDAIIDLSEKYYRILEKEYDYLTSDDAIIETIKANDYEFLEDGRLL